MFLRACRSDVLVDPLENVYFGNTRVNIVAGHDNSEALYKRPGETFPTIIQSKLADTFQISGGHPERTSRGTGLAVVPLVFLEQVVRWRLNWMP